MAKPAILAVDDDVAVVGAVVRDLRQQYGADYRILRATSGPRATGEPAGEAVSAPAMVTS